MTQGCYIRVHVGSDDAFGVSVGQLCLMKEFIGLKLAHLFFQCGGHLAIREKRQAVLCYLISAPHDIIMSGYLRLWRTSSLLEPTGLVPSHQAYSRMIIP